MNRQPVAESKPDVPAVVMGLALGLAIATVSMAILAVLSRDCATIGAFFGLIAGGVPALLAFVITWNTVALQRRNNESVSGLTLTRFCWSVAALSTTIVVIASAFSHAIAGECTP